MDEKIKKEIEELERGLKEEDKKKDSESLSLEEKPLTTSFFSSKLLIFLGIGLTIILIFLGLIFFYKFFLVKEQTPEKTVSQKDSQTLKEEKPTKTSYSKEKISFSVSETKYPYKLELKNFLVTLDAKNFLKLDVVFYFEKDSELKTAMEKELVYRDFIFKFVQGIKATKWKEESYVKSLEKNLIQEMMKREIKPLPKVVEIDGYLLKA